MVSPRYEGDDTGREDRPEGRLDSREGVLRVARDRVDVARIDRIEDSERVYAGEHVVRSHETGRVPNRGGTFPGPAPVRRRIDDRRSIRKISSLSDIEIAYHYAPTQGS